MVIKRGLELVNKQPKLERSIPRLPLITLLKICFFLGQKTDMSSFFHVLSVLSVFLLIDIDNLFFPRRGHYKFLKEVNAGVKSSLKSVI